MADEITLDLDELRHLLNVAKRPRVVSVLSTEIKSLEKLSTNAQASSPVPAKVTRTPETIYSAVGSFSWDQDNDKVKVYLSLEGVEKEKLKEDFKHMSFDVKFHDVQGKNYRFGIPKLNKEIQPEKCKVLVKSTRVVVTLWKASRDNWSDLHFKEDKMKPSLDKEKDPMSGIMDLMKNMYDEGDDEMKRTIAKAWTDSRSGKAGDAMKDYR